MNRVNAIALLLTITICGSQASSKSATTST